MFLFFIFNFICRSCNLNFLRSYQPLIMMCLMLFSLCSFWCFFSHVSQYFPSAWRDCANCSRWATRASCRSLTCPPRRYLHYRLADNIYRSKRRVSFNIRTDHMHVQKAHIPLNTEVGFFGPLLSPSQSSYHPEQKLLKNTACEWDDNDVVIRKRKYGHARKTIAKISFSEFYLRFSIFQ